MCKRCQESHLHEPGVVYAGHVDRCALHNAIKNVRIAQMLINDGRPQAAIDKLDVVIAHLAEVEKEQEPEKDGQV